MVSIFVFTRACLQSRRARLGILIAFGGDCARGPFLFLPRFLPSEISSRLLILKKVELYESDSRRPLSKCLVQTSTGGSS